MTIPEPRAVGDTTPNPESRPIITPVLDTYLETKQRAQIPGDVEPSGSGISLVR